MILTLVVFFWKNCNTFRSIFSTRQYHPALPLVNRYTGQKDNTGNAGTQFKPNFKKSTQHTNRPEATLGSKIRTVREKNSHKSNSRVYKIHLNYRCAHHITGKQKATGNHNVYGKLLSNGMQKLTWRRTRYPAYCPPWPRMAFSSTFRPVSLRCTRRTGEDARTLWKRRLLWSSRSRKNPIHVRERL